MLPVCCEKALAAGIPPAEHAPDCVRQPAAEASEDLVMDTLFDLPAQPERGGQHP